MDATPPTPTSRGTSPQRFGRALLGLLQGHIALFAEEFKEKQSHTLNLLLIAFWETHRLLVISGLCAFYALGLLSALITLLQRVRNAPAPFSASLEELARDREQLLP